MNIFVVDYDPKQAARDLCDQHNVKMPTESAQMLSTWARWQTKFKLDFDKLYKSTYFNSPNNKWLRESPANVAWLLTHAEELLLEYTSRYDKYHKAGIVINYIKSNIHLPSYKEVKQFALVMPEIYRKNCPVESYRLFYKTDKVKFARWNHSNTPTWWRD
jgi:hypothetical protein